MKRKILTSIFVAALVLGCKEEQVNKNSAMDKSTENVFLKKWEGDYNGVPAFDEMELSQLKPAMQKAMKMHCQINCLNMRRQEFQQYVQI